MQICDDFLKGQNEEMLKEIKAGKDPAALEERLKKIHLANEVVDLGNWIVTGTWKSQFQRNPALFTETKKLFEKVYAKLDELKAITRQELNLKQIEECRKAGKTYEGNMEAFLAKWLEREEVTKKRGVVADEVLSPGQGDRPAGDVRHRERVEGSGREPRRGLHGHDRRAGRGHGDRHRAGGLHHALDHRPDPAHHRRDERGLPGSVVGGRPGFVVRPSRWPRARASRRPRSRRPPRRWRRCPP